MFDSRDAARNETLDGGLGGIGGGGGDCAAGAVFPPKTCDSAGLDLRRD